MRIVIDRAAGALTTIDGPTERTHGLYTKEAFEILSREWVRVGWSLRYYHTFSWLGLPVLQLPEDLVRIQEVIWEVRPDVIIETGIFQGGSLVFYASICEALGRGRVIGIDVKIEPFVREALEAHQLAARISLFEGDSASEATLGRVREQITPGESVLVVLDSCHSKQHVTGELKLWSPLVTPGSWIVATDGIMRDLADVPRGQPEWAADNPAEAADEFAREHPEFVLEQPPWPVCDSELSRNVTYWPGAWLRRLPDGSGS